MVDSIRFIRRRVATT